MKTKLTPDLLERLSAIDGLWEIESIVDDAVKGNGPAIRNLTLLSVQLSKNQTWNNWPGPEPMEEINEAIRRVIDTAKRNSTTARSRHQSISIKNKPPQRIGDVLSKITIPNQQANAADQVSFTRNLLHAPSDTDDVPDQPKWRDLAKASDFPLYRLTRGACEILALVERLLIRRGGWGPKDKYKGLHRTLPLVPSKLSNKGLKCSTRTYQRAIKHLVTIGLLIHIETRLNGERTYTASWWHGVQTNSPSDAWQTATSRQRERDGNLSDQGRTDAGHLSDQCRTSVVPPVASISDVSTCTSNELVHAAMRQTVGRITSNIYISHLNGAVVRPLDHATVPRLACLKAVAARSLISLRRE